MISQEKINKLLNTPPCIGVEIETKLDSFTRRVTAEQDKYIAECLTRCNIDPDALIKTTEKNKELMKALDELNIRLAALDVLLQDVNVDEIEAHADNRETLTSWCNAWRRQAQLLTRGGVYDQTRTDL